MSTQPLTRQERRRMERERRKQYRRQPYLEEVLSAVAADPSVAIPGQWTFVSILHDDWCPKLAGGLCRCAPIVRFETQPEPWGDAA